MAQDEYVTQREFQEFSSRTDARIENLQKDMNAGFLHITERMDDGFLKLSQRIDDKFASVQKQISDEADKASERQKESRRFLWTIAATAIGAAAGVLALILR